MNARRRIWPVRALRAINESGAVGWLMFVLAIVGVAAVLTMLLLGTGADGAPLLDVQLPTTSPATEKGI